MSENTHLNFNEFKLPDNNQWESKIVNELKGKSIDSICSNNLDNLKISPFYANQFFDSESFFYAEGSKNSETNYNVLLREKISITDLHFPAEKIDLAINGGINSLLFSGNIEHIKNEIKLLSSKNIHLTFQLNSNANNIFDEINSFFNELKNYSVGIEYDPILHLITNGFWLEGKEDDFNKVAYILKCATENNKNYPKCIHINATVYHNTGASFVQELAYAIAHANEYITFLLGRGFDLKTIFSCMHFSFSIGTDYFSEIAKLRAFKILWANLINSYDSELTHIPCSINAETSYRYHSNRDEHNNILRTTTQAMSAIIGGCNTLCILPYNFLNKADEHSRRIARNIGNILLHESGFNGIHNSANGAYFIEYVTTEITKKAWFVFVEIENAGGILQSLFKNKLQQEVKKSRENELENFKSGKQVLVGVNKYNKNSEVNTDKSTSICQRNNLIIEPLDEFRIATYL